MPTLYSLDWDDKHYQVDLDSVTAREFAQIQVNTGLSAGTFIRSLTSLADFDAQVAVGLLWLLKVRAGEDAGFDHDLPVLQFMAALERVQPKVPAPKVKGASRSS